MRFVKAAVLVGLFCLCLGALLVLTEGKADPVDQPQFEKLAMWGGDTLVHQGYISRYSRNGYSADYDDGWNWIYAAVTRYSSGPDTCYLYVSLTGASSWITNWPYHYVSQHGTDLCNPQVVKGEGSHPQEYYFLLDRLYGDIILYRRAGMSVDTFYLSDGNESFSATRDDPSDQNYRLHMARATNLGEVVYSYSTNYGQNWQTKDTVDGDMPHIATAGENGEEVYLTWRLDGENGAFYGAYDSIWSSTSYACVAKNSKSGTGTWRRSVLCNYPSWTECLLQASDGIIYAGIDTFWEELRAAVLKSQDGGETWTLTDDLGDQEYIEDLLEYPDGTIYAATGKSILLSGAEVYKTTNGGTTWSKTGNISGVENDHAYCLARSAGGTIYVGTGFEGDVFKSTDGGDHWDECADLTGAWVINGIIVTQSGTIIAGGERESAESLGVFRSTNGGDSWSYIEPPSTPLIIGCLFQASNGYIYAGAVRPTKSNAGIMKSTNDGVSWTWTSFNSSGYICFIMEASNSYLYTSNGSQVYRSINQGDTWTPWSSSPGLFDMIQSKHQIAVKKSTNRGSSWGNTEVLSSNLNYEKSDPKVAGVYNNTYSVWVTYAEKNTSDHWNLKYAQSSYGLAWSKNHTLAGASGSDQQLCDLACRRGEDYYVHAAYCSDETGSRKLYYRYANDVNPTDWSDTLRITGLRPTLEHTPEVCFYQDNPVIFYSWGFGIGPEYPQHLYVNAQHFTAVEEEERGESRMSDFSLSQNYPNPFNPTTTLHFAVNSPPSAVRKPIPTTLKIYNVMGQEVRTLVDEPKQAGSYQVIWDGKNENGEEATSGIYFCKLKVGDNCQTKKMVLIK
jgi:photosystem II stability/assembly factor-like uncharacterized protein